MKPEARIAYFSMEIGFDARVPTYSGGLGILAGDTLRAAADLGVPMVAVTLLHRKGYFYQHLDALGQQTEEAVRWPIDDFLESVDVSIQVEIEGRPVRVGAKRTTVIGIKGHGVPIYFLDCDLPENSDWDRELTHYLYGRDAHYRLCQEVVLGVGGIRILEALGYASLQRYHMNEGHASLLALELLDQSAEAAGRDLPDMEDVEAVRRKCVFTTHTPVPAGHDQFPLNLVSRVLGDHVALSMENVVCCDGLLNMTYLALNLSHYVNGVAKRHGEVSQLMFANYRIDSITNGIHAGTWCSPDLQELYDQHIPGWREDNFSLRSVLSIPTHEMWEAHQKAKRQLLREVNRSCNAGMDQDVLTLGFARRATAYKRPELLLHDIDRLKAIASSRGGIQIIYSGKAHPNDNEGKSIIGHIFEARQTLGDVVRLAYLENYDIDVAKLLVAGVDVWVNTPQPPLEASGTSGMKAAVNGVPSLSVLDGWWIEGCIPGVTGWPIGNDGHAVDGAHDNDQDADYLYKQLAETIMPMYYNDRDAFVNVMRHAAALNGSYFNTSRMMQQYVLKAYF